MWIQLASVACLLLSTSAFNMDSAGCLIGHTNPTFTLPYLDENNATRTTTISFGAAFNATCVKKSPLGGHITATVTVADGNDSLVLSWATTGGIYKTIRLTGVHYSYVQDRDRFPNAMDEGARKRASLSPSVSIKFPRDHAWDCGSLARPLALSGHGSFSFGPTHIAVLFDTMPDKVSYCMAEAPMYSAQLADGRNVIMNGTFAFSLSYNATAGNGTVMETNTHLAVSEARVTAKELNETVSLVLTWGKDKKMKSVLEFVMEEEESNMTKLSMVKLTTFQTPEFGFANASVKGQNMELAFKGDDSQSWMTAGGFKCDAMVKMAAGKMDSLMVKDLKLQVLHDPEFNTTTLKDCAEDATTMAPKTTTAKPPPVPVENYGVKGADGKYCILLKSAVTFHVHYDMNMGNTSETKDHDFWLPAKGAIVSGNCDINNATEQEIVINFNTTWSMTMKISNQKMYTNANDLASFTVYQVVLKGNLPKELNATKSAFSVWNEVNMTTGVGALKGFLTGTANKSIQCSEYKSAALGTLQKDNVSIVVDMSDVKFQAFASAKNDTDFSTASDCPSTAGGGSDLVPIIVGACLAALVVIVLVAYLIGRARARRGGYQSV